MIVFLTSSPTGPLDGSRKVDGLDEKNSFISNLKKYWKPDGKSLIITAFPDDDAANDEMRQFMEGAFAKAGMTSSVFDIWDGRTSDYSKETLQSYDVILLGGGHVPTQNRFFAQIGLREKIAGFKGIVIGISAGTMNSADDVYAQPELPGEATDPNYIRYMPGLNLTKTQTLPHYQMVKDNYLDGMRLYDDITYGDSWGKEFVVMADGSYLLIEHGRETVYGDTWLISDGKIRKICDDNHQFIWKL